MVIYLSEKNLVSNYKYLTNKSYKIWPCLKKNAYGLGINNILSILISNNLFIDGVSTDNVDDFKYIRYNFKGNILYFGNISYNNMKYFKKYNIIPSIYSLENIKYFKNYKNPVFVKINLGLNRYGCNLSEAENLICKIKSLGVYIIGIIGHFSMQCLENYNNNLEYYNFLLYLKNKFNIKYISCLSSETLVKYKYFPKNISRPGIGLYGYLSNNTDIKLKNVIYFFNKISHIRYVKSGETLSYGTNTIINEDKIIGVVPIGYSDGLLKLFEGKGFFIIKNKKCKILSISMSNSFLEIGTNVNIGDTVEIVGNNISLYDWAQWGNTIPQEILLNFCRGKIVLKN